MEMKKAREYDEFSQRIKNSSVAVIYCPSLSQLTEDGVSKSRTYCDDTKSTITVQSC